MEAGSAAKKVGGQDPAASLPWDAMHSIQTWNNMPLYSLKTDTLIAEQRWLCPSPSPSLSLNFPLLDDKNPAFRINIPMLEIIILSRDFLQG